MTWQNTKPRMLWISVGRCICYCQPYMSKELSVLSKYSGPERSFQLVVGRLKSPQATSQVKSRNAVLANNPPITVSVELWMLGARYIHPLSNLHSWACTVNHNESCSFLRTVIYFSFHIFRCIYKTTITLLSDSITEGKLINVYLKVWVRDIKWQVTVRYRNKWSIVWK